MARFGEQVLSYGLMANHHHFVLHTRQGRPSALMQYINGVYNQATTDGMANWGTCCRADQGILVDQQAHLPEVCRFVGLKPVRAGLVACVAYRP